MRHANPMFMPRQLSHMLDAVARQAMGKDWALYSALLEHWVEIVGPEYARQTTPVKVQFPHQPNESRRKNGVLTVRLPKGLAMEFTFKGEVIRQRVNAYFGYEAVARIVLDPVHGQLRPARAAKPGASIEDSAAVQTYTETVEDDALRQALQSFGEALSAGGIKPVKQPRDKA